MIKAKRAGTWFRLPRQERGMFELAMRLDVKLRSHDLLKALVSVLRDLRDRFDGGYHSLMKAMSVAWSFSEAASRWGNARAREWRYDQGYIRFLAITLGCHRI